MRNNFGHSNQALFFSNFERNMAVTCIRIRRKLTRSYL
jgi:hypothetical protein